MRYLLAASAVAVGLAAGCGSTGSPPASTTPATRAGAAETATAVTSGVSALPTRPGPLPAGRYATATFRPAVVLDLPAGFQLQRPEYADWLSLVNNDGAISILDIDSAQVVDPKASANPTVDDLRAPPGDLAAWFSEHPSLVVSEPKNVTVAGVPGKQLDVRAKPGLAQDPALLYTHEILLTQPKGAVARTIILATGGHQVAITLLAFEDRLDTFASTAGQIVSSLELNSNPPTATAPVAGANCDAVQTFPSVGRNHVLSPPPASTYNSFPPTSGPHYPSPAPWAVYTQPFPQFVLVHNLEHGGIAVQYGKSVPAATVSKMAAWINSDPNGMLMAPLPQLGSKIAVTAWTHLMKCTAFDEQAFSSFRDAFRYKGPELLPAQTYKPTPPTA